MDTNDFGITKNILNEFTLSRNILVENFTEILFMEKYKKNLLKKYFKYIKNIIDNKWN